MIIRINKNAEMKNILFLFVAMCLFFSCKTDSTSSSNQSQDLSEEYKAAWEKLSSEPGKASASNYIKEVTRALQRTDDKAMKEDFLIKGLKVAEEYKMGPTAIGFLMPLAKDFSNPTNAEEYQAKLASALADIGKQIPGDILIDAYLKKYPEGKFKDLLLNKQSQKIENVDTYLADMAKEIFVNPDKFGINRMSAQKYVDGCEAYALGYSDSKSAPEYLYKAAEMARTLKTYPKALNLYDWIENSYPDYEKSAVTMFLKGFMLENELNDKASAKKVYQEFTSKYPEHDLQDDVKFLLDNIDKSDEEIMKIIEKK